MSGEAWSDVRYHLCAASRLVLLDVPEIVITGYHIVWYILAAFLLINVIIGAVISNFESAMREKRKQQERAERAAERAAERKAQALAQKAAAANAVAVSSAATEQSTIAGDNVAQTLPTAGTADSTESGAQSRD